MPLPVENRIAEDGCAFDVATAAGSREILTGSVPLPTGHCAKAVRAICGYAAQQTPNAYSFVHLIYGRIVAMLQTFSCGSAVTATCNCKSKVVG